MNLNLTNLTTNFSFNNVPKDFHIDTEKISTDSRKIRPGEYFFAIKGETYDGNNFIENAIKNGASLIFTSNNTLAKKFHQTIPIITLRDDKKALADLARIVLSQSKTKKIAITGSNGKTTCKEILYSLLKQKFITLRNPGNFNNNIGLPLSLFKLKTNHQFSILELGMNAKGEIDSLAELLSPHYSIITNIAHAHLDKLKTLKNIAEAKSEIIPHTQEKTIINLDSPELLEKITSKNKILTFSLSNTSADIYTEAIIESNLSYSKFILTSKLMTDNSIEITLPLAGQHNITNYLPAYLAARLFGLSINDIIEATKEIKPYEGRYSVKNINGITIINDAYNANPDSMKAGLLHFAKQINKEKIAVLGQMNELGKDTEKIHFELGVFAAKLQINYIFTFGELGTCIYKGLRSAKYNNTIHCKTEEDLIGHLQKKLKTGDSLFLKASNKLKLWELSSKLYPGS